MGWDQGYWLEYDGTGNLVRWNFFLNKREANTDECIAQVNKVLWEHHEESVLMQKYGLSEENPLTFEWIIANPREAYTLVTLNFRPYECFPVLISTTEDDFFEENNIPILPPSK